MVFDIVKYKIIHVFIQHCCYRVLLLGSLHAESPGFDSPHLHAIFEWSRVRLTLGANLSTYSSVVERSIAELFLLVALVFFLYQRKG